MFKTLLPLLSLLSPTAPPAPLPAHAPPAFPALFAPARAGQARLQIDCPASTKLFCGDSTDPNDTGYPVVSGGCGNYVITYSDAYVQAAACPVDRFDERILRTWTATDACKNSVSCTQRLDVVRTMGFLDIKPPSCPNPFNLNGGGVMQVSIVGTPTFDVTTIDTSTIQLWTRNCAQGPVGRLSTSYEDKATPFGLAGACACHTLGPDGILDLTVRFSHAAVQSGLQLDNHPPGSFVKLYISAQLVSGCGFVAWDCVRIQ